MSSQCLLNVRLSAGRGRVGAFALAVIFVGIVAMAAPAWATLITAGEEIPVTFVPPATNLTLTGSMNLLLVSLTTTTATIQIDVTNTNTDPMNARLVSIDFTMTPTPSPFSETTTFISGTNAFMTVDSPDNVPSLTGNTCAFGSNNCNAGNTGLQNTAPNDDKFSFLVSGTFDPTIGLDFTNFGVKWTNCAGCSFEVPGTPGTPITTQSVPVPGTLILLGTGLTGLGIARRVRFPRS